MIGGDDGAVLPVDGCDDHAIRHGGGDGPGGTEGPSPRLRGSDSPDGAFDSGHVLLRRVCGRGARESDTANNCSSAVPVTVSAGGGGGGGGLTTSVPGAPRNLTAVGGNGEVVLTWDAPSSDGGAEITDYEYRYRTGDSYGAWISTGSIETTYTVTGLDNGTAYTFQVRAVNRLGEGRVPRQAETMPEAPEVFALNFAHFANGTGIVSEVVLVNGAPPSDSTRPLLLRSGRRADRIGIGIQEDGGLTVQSAMEPLGELTISTHNRGDLVSGSVKVLSYGVIGGVLRFDLPGVGVAGVGASHPVRDAVFPVRREAGGISPAVTLHNLGEEVIEVTCRLMSGGVVLEEEEIPLAANGQEAQYIEEMFTTTDTSGFVGSVRCSAPALFTGVALELDAANRIFTTLPVVPVPERTSQE